MKVIFLDVDGVLNRVSGPNGIKDSTYFKYAEHMEKEILLNLNDFIEKSNVNIVISSSWRSDMEDLKYNLEKNGFLFWKRIVGRTLLNSKYRGEQILEYLKENPNITEYIVIDDCIADIHGEDKEYQFIEIKNCLKTDPKIGLRIKDFEFLCDFFKV